MDKTISGRYLIVGAALFLMLASNAHAEPPKKEKIRTVQPSVISSSNPITASVGRFTGDAVTPGFQSVGTAASLSISSAANLIISNPSTVTVLNTIPAAYTSPTASSTISSSLATHAVVQTAPAASISQPTLTSSLTSSSLASAGLIQTIPAAVKPLTLNGTQIKPDSTLLSASLTSLATMPGSGLQPLKALETSTLSTGIVNASLSSSPLLCIAQSANQLLFKAEGSARVLLGNISWNNEEVAPLSKIDGSHSFQETAAQTLTNSKTPVQDNKTLQAGKRTVNALITEAKQTCAAAKMLAKQAHALSQKTASSVIDGFYAVQKSLSTAKVTAMKHIKCIPNLKNKAYEHTSGWIKGIIPILKLVIPNEELPLLMDLLLQDSNTLPVASAGNEHKDPLPAPLRKAFEDRNSGDQNPLSETIARVAWKPINPTHSIDITNMVHKSAVNYNKTGLSPPQTVSSHSTALFSASNRSIRSRSALCVAADIPEFNKANSIDVFPLLNYIINNTHPLPLLVSGGINFKGRGFCLFNNRLTKGGYHV